MVESGVGIALSPQIYCEQLDRAKFSVSLVEQPSLRWNLNMAWNSTVVMNPATRAWLSIIDEYKIKFIFRYFIFKHALLKNDHFDYVLIT